MTSRSLVLRLVFTLSTFIVLSTILFFLTIGHIIAFIGFLILVWIFCWSISRPFVEYQFLNHDIVSFTNKAVLVTGCDSGFGKRVSIKLSNIGYHVFACCFSKETDGYKELVELSKTSKGQLDVILLDVTSDESVDFAYEFVKQNLNDNEKLWAVVNNAGIGGYHGWNWQSNPVDFYQKIISVNSIAVVRISHKFSKLLLECSNSRFVTLSSYAGRLSFSGMVAYCMSKHSTRVFGNCLRRELDHLNIKSIIIEPTMYKTEMTNAETNLQMFDRSWQTTDEELKKKIGLDFYHQMRQGLIALMNTTRDEVDDVVDTIVKAVRLSDPYPFYKVSNFFQLFTLNLLEYLPEETHDLLLTGGTNNLVMGMFKLSNQV